MKKVEDCAIYEVKLPMKDDSAIHVWIDAQTFLAGRIEGQRKLVDGVYHPAEIY